MEKTKQPIARLLCGSDEYLLFPGKTLRIGRSDDNDIILNDPKVSRVHAELVWEASVFSLRDLGSVNGTFVNGERLSESSRVLRDGDEILLSKQSMRYEMVRIAQTEALGDLPPAEPFPTEQLLAREGPYLVVLAGPDKGQAFPLWGEVITIGRASREATWEIRLTDRAVSRPHARLERGPDSVLLLDLESANGTLLNGAALEAPEQIKDGDVISVGETQLVYRASGSG
jgi:pSer/pThr/pTyr-binding forkhead associated (FHA) protein